MKSTLGNWNFDVAFMRMSRLSYRQIRELSIGEHIYYVNLDDDIAGVIYDAQVVGKTQYLLVLSCTPIKETITSLSFNNVTSTHVESFSFIEAMTKGSHQMLFDNLVFKEDLNWKTQLLRESL